MMIKTSAALAMLSAFVFTNANAPTYQLWRDLPVADIASIDPVDHSSDDASGAFAFGTMNQELNEEDALERFEIDEWFLPHLNVDMPELFDWSDSDSTYLAYNTPAFIDGLASPRSHYSGAGVIQLASLNGVPAVPGGGSAQVTATKSTELTVPAITETEDTLITDAGKTSDSGTAPPPADPVGETREVPTESGPGILPQPSEISPPVQVPAPGMFGLFVLGLAGLRLAGRKKNGSG